jgi:hypothetical protein
MVTFEANPNDNHSGYLRIAPDCTLDQLYQYSQCPPMLHNTLHKMVSWHTRNETSIEKALRSLHRFPQFQACLMVLEMTETEEGYLLAIGAENIRLGYSEIRATPADEPIVAAYISISIEDGHIARCRAAVTGAHTKSPYLLEGTENLTGKKMDGETRDRLLSMVDQELAPEADYQGSVEYRRAMVQVAVKRAYQQCVEGN